MRGGAALFREEADGFSFRGGDRHSPYGYAVKL